MGDLPKIDVHIHLTGTGCCDSGCWISPKFQKRMTFRALRFVQGVSDRQMETDVDVVWADRIHSLLKESSLDYGVVLGFDKVFDHDSGCVRQDVSQMYVPPQWVFKVCRERPGLLPGPSVNPFAKDALETLDFCIQEGAVLIKWLPATQGIDPASPKLREFYRRLADQGLPLLIHTGGERTFAEVEPLFSRLERIIPPLEAGVSVICAHTSTRVLGSRDEDQIPLLKELMQTYPQLYVDNSGICNPSRFAHLPRLAADPQIMSRTLYGSDWPVPSNAIYFMNRLPIKKVLELEQIKNPFDRDVAIKRAFAVPEETLVRAHQVLANLQRWMPQGQSPSTQAQRHAT